MAWQGWGGYLCGLLPWGPVLRRLFAPLLWAAGWLLNRAPADWAPRVPRVVVESAYRQIQRRRLEGF